MRGRVAVQAEELRLVVVSEQRDSGPVDEGEVPVVIDDVQAVRGLLGDPKRDVVSDSQAAR